MGRLGLIVNPVAGMGGSVGLKGTDGLELLERAEQLGAVPRAHQRAESALKTLAATKSRIEVLTFGDVMGEAAAIACGLKPTVVGAPSKNRTTPDDTVRAAREMLRHAVDLLLFVGGDGTARDICSVIGTGVPALGVPAGVKIQSAVFATSPQAAGQLARSFLAQEVRSTREAEVIDIDEEAYRNEVLSSRLYGYLQIPDGYLRTQGAKVASPHSEHVIQQAIGAELAERMTDDRCYIIGPGTTCRAITETLKLEGSLLGVDVVQHGRLVGKDLSEQEILSEIADEECVVIVTPIGGQGFVFGRGNQQISPGIIRRVGKENIVVVATGQKLASLGGRPLLVDTGDAALDEQLRGYYRVITGYREIAVYRLGS